MTKRKANPQGRPNARDRELRRRFILFYCHPDYARNATKAAIDAGYAPGSAKVTACRLLQNEDVRVEIDRELERQIERTRVDAVAVSRELARVGKVNIRDLLEIRTVKKGRSIRQELFLKADSIDQLHPDDTAAIRELEPTKDGIRVKLHDKIGALRILDRQVERMNPQRPQYTPEQRIALLLGLFQVLAKRRKESLALPEGQQIA